MSIIVGDLKLADFKEFLENKGLQVGLYFLFWTYDIACLSQPILHVLALECASNGFSGYVLETEI